ncbi:MAG: bacillithiol biosynthesis BshC [bacterium]
MSSAPRVERSERLRVERLAGMPGGDASRLIADYVRGEPALDPFFGRRVASLDDFEPPPRTRSLLDAGGRRALVKVLRDSPGVVPSAAAQQESLAALEDESTLAVVTGQQPGLFLGSLLTLYKATSVIGLARRLSKRLSRTVVPVFWLVSEDDDLSEISETRLVTGKEESRLVRLFPDPAAAEKRTYASIRGRDLSESAARQVVDLLPEGPARGEIIDSLLASAREETPVRSFAKLLGSLLAPYGLVILDPSDARIKQLAAPFVAREMRALHATAAAARAAGERLEDLGYHAQVRVDGERSALFDVRDGRRARADAASAVESIAPGVLIRPAYQDFLLPTIAYVGGPAEVAYLAQVGESYERHEVPRPVALPRLSAILVEPETAAFLERSRLDLASLRNGGGAPAPEAPLPDELLAVRDPAESLDAALLALSARLASIAPPLEAMVGGARKKIRHEIERVIESARKQLDRDAEMLRRRSARARERLFPDGKPQERVYSPLTFLVQWPDLIETLIDAYDPSDARPILIALPAAERGTLPGPGVSSQ